MLTVEEAIVRWAAEQINVHYSKVEEVNFSIAEASCETCDWPTDIAQIKWDDGSNNGRFNTVEVDDITGLIRNITARMQ